MSNDNEINIKELNVKETSDAGITERKTAGKKKLRKQLLQFLVFGCLMFALGIYAGRISSGEEEKNGDELLMAETEMSVISSEPAKVASAPVEEIIAETKPEEPVQEEIPEEENLPADWNLILVNAAHSLPKDFKVEVRDVGSGHKLDARIVEDYKNMIKDAKKDGAIIYLTSSYRTLEKQISLHRKKVDEYLRSGYSYEEALAKASTIVAIPGTSEHQLGLAVDLISAEYKKLDEKQEQTKGFRWLKENCWKYGFILRYPNGKTDITGIIYEPWHFRYVGKEAALEMYMSGQTLEEYVGAKPIKESE